MTDTTNGGGLGHVREGMKVVDSHGDDVGTVKAVHMGDPDAVTAEGQTMTTAGFDDDAPPAGAAERLARVGYLQIDAKGWFAGTRWAGGDEVADVAGDVVHLSVDKDGLLK